MKTSVLVIGLGRFGAAAARELMALGHEVLAVDTSETVVNEIAPEVTHAVQLDAADEAALRAIGAAEFEHAIVGISSGVEASVFAVMALKQLGVANVIAKAGSPLHGAILERVGANRVVFAEREMGQRVAHSFAMPDIVDYLDVAPRFGIVRVRPTERWAGRPLSDLDGALTAVALRRGDAVTVNPSPDERVQPGDEVILIGKDDLLERLGSG
ncbi:MAG TPA: TrkA family potassium uptake protein [Candidatus Limnocylindrales bacterium]|jgi:trk system potassium uptake protein TrkA|nr:TrkA family potassium uptake protein [Candidatus Limnocylindrales bacterium]